MTETEFSKEIRSGKMSGVYFLCGDEDYLKNYRTGEAKRCLTENDPAAAFNLVELSFGEDECDTTAVNDAVSAPAMFSSLRLTILSFSDFDSIKERDKTSLLSILESHASDPDSAVIVKVSGGGFDCGTDKKPSAALKSFSKFAKVVRFDYQPPSKLFSWLSKHAEKYSLTLSPDAAELMINISGRAMYTLCGEIAKVCAYTASNGRKTITADDVSLCCSHTDEDDAFRLANAVTDGNTEEAYRCLGVKIRLRSDPYILLGQITKTFTDLAAASAYICDGRDVSEFAKELKIHEFRAKLYYKAAKNAPYDYFRRAVDLCLTADRNMKTTGTRGYGEIERLIGLAARR